jgi:GNAT superfamily N-acetyltransferase
VDALGIGVDPEGVEVKLHESADEFRAIAEPLYRRDPVAHTIELTLLRAGRFPENSLFLTMWDGGDAVGAALQTPPYPLACNGIPVNAMDTVASKLVAWRPELTGVRGARSRALTFADAWHATSGRAGTHGIEERLYRLGTLRVPDDVTGASRLATNDDRDQLVEWLELFFRETFSQRDEAAGGRFLDAANHVGNRFTLWDVDGVPTSMAMLRAPAAGVSRIGPVFTPRDHRGHGYGSAVAAAASELARRNGVDDVVLFADLANPTTNAIYQRIGFEAVCDSLRVEFSPPSPAPRACAG